VSIQPRPANGPAFSPDQPLTGRVAKYALTVDLETCRIYVLDKATGKPVARYLTSPGRKSFPTLGDHFVIQRTLVKAPWYPPKSSWAEGAKVVPGGMQNPMGIFKMDLGGHSQYIHGTPADERGDLGHPASHGCLRMSNENVLQLFQRYAGAGTEVTINRDPKVSQQLRAAFRAQGLKDHKITDGAELLRDAARGKAPKPQD
jgi:lipoprotein-anchoring transpeptidase ErfK/SrfK